MKCLNCEKQLQPADAYCSACGQSASTERFQTQHVLHHFYHAFTHTDKGFFYLIRELIIRPGDIAREYNEGKRKTYFSPFTFFIIVAALSTLLVTTFNIMNVKEASNPIDNFSSKHFNIIILIAIPLIGFFTTVLFKNKGINFAEGIVLALYTSGERSIFFMILVVPMMIIFRGQYNMILAAYFLLFAMYYAWACCQYFSDYRWITWLKGIMCFVFAQIGLTALFAIAHTIYHFSK